MRFQGRFSALRTVAVGPARLMVLASALVSAFVLFGACFPALAQQEVINRFESAVEVRADGGMLVTETIEVQALGQEIKRGIFRDFPTTYKNDQGRTVRVPFDVRQVLRDGRPEPHFTEAAANGVRLYIGDKNVFLDPGTHVYAITYETNGQIGFFQDHDELYWNVTGNGWIFPILEAKALVSLPGLVRPTMLDAWTGYQGATGDDPRVKAFTEGHVRGVTVFKTTRPLAPSEGLTIAVGFDKGLVAEPSPLAGNRHLIWGLGALGLLLAYYLFAWNRVGRDPRGGSIIPLFEPPKGVSPAGCRHVMRMGYDNTCFAAAVLSSAVRGAVVVEEPKKREFSLKKPADQFGPDALLSSDEKALVKELFDGRDELVLKQTNHAAVSTVRTAFKRSLKSRYGAKYFKRNAAWLAPGVGITLAGLAALTLLSPTGDDERIFSAMMTVVVLIWSAVTGSLWASATTTWRGRNLFSKGVVLILGTVFTLPLAIAGLALAVMLSPPALGLVAGLAVTNLVFFRLLRAYTVKGRRTLDEIEGFKQYLSVAEKHRLEFLNPPEETPELFERYLPYALALGVEQRWSERFAEVLSRAMESADKGWHPVWYHGYGYGLTGDRLAGHLGAGLGAGLAGAVASSSRAPGSSSGFSGGGSSGGGGGGGGGGGW